MMFQSTTLTQADFRRLTKVAVLLSVLSQDLKHPDAQFIHHHSKVQMTFPA